MLYKYIMPVMSKPIRVNTNVKATKALRPQLAKYLLSVEHLISKKSREKFEDIFENSNKSTLI
jgi:hypothetical protein